MKSWQKNIATPPSLLMPAIRTEIASLTAKAKSPQGIGSSDFKSAIYAAQDVKSRLIADQHGKCAYCETSLLPIACGDVEHYRPKTSYSQVRRRPYKPAYYWLAYDWKNLMAVCPACNRHKGVWFPLMDPKARDIAHQNISKEDPLILNPYDDCVEEHLEYRAFHVFPKTSKDGSEDIKGRTTIDAVGLEREDLVEERRRAWFAFRNDRQGMTYAEGVRKMENKMKGIGCTRDDIPFQNMFYNQIFQY